MYQVGLEKRVIFWKWATNIFFGCFIASLLGGLIPKENLSFLPSAISTGFLAAVFCVLCFITILLYKRTYVAHYISKGMTKEQAKEEWDRQNPPDTAPF